jgi:hypothetical protein
MKYVLQKISLNNLPLLVGTLGLTVGLLGRDRPP